MSSCDPSGTPINLGSIIYDTVTEHKTVFLSVTMLVAAYWFKNVVFSNSFGKVTTNIPGFVNNMSVKVVFLLLLPFIISEVLYYFHSTIMAHKVPQIELSIIKKLINEAIESVKTTKCRINVNEFILNLKKVIETKTIYQLMVSYIVPTILVTIGIFYYFAKSNIKVGLGIMIVILIFFYITFKVQKESVLMAHQNETTLNELYDNVQDVLINLDTVVTSNTKEHEMKNISQEASKSAEVYKNTELEISNATLSLHLMSIVIFLFVLGIGIKMYIDKDITAELLASIGLMSVLFMQFYNSTVDKLKYSVPAIGKYSKLEEYFSQFKIKKKDDEVGKTDGLDIKFVDFGLKYGDKTVLKNFKESIKFGQKIGIVGNIGTGKSSLLKALAGLNTYEGKIMIGNVELHKLGYNKATQTIGYIPQHPKMFNKTIYYNISYGTSYSPEYVMNFIKEIGFEDFINKFPQGLNTPVGKEGSNLSGGQKQIIAIIRALLQDKQIILLDEPTSSLDGETKKMVIRLLKEIKDKTLLIVSHDDDLDVVFDDVIVLG